MTARHPTVGGKQKRIRQERPPKPIVLTIPCECGKITYLDITKKRRALLMCDHCGATLHWDQDGQVTIEVVEETSDLKIGKFVDLIHNTAFGDKAARDLRSFIYNKKERKSG